MSVDVNGTLATYVKNSTLVITPDIEAQFGTAIGTAITQLFGGTISLGNGFSLTGDANSATIIGTGSAAPLVSAFTVKAIFDDASGDVGAVSLTFNASIASDITLSDAWPTLLNQYPFTQVVLTGGTMNLVVEPGDSSYKMKLTADVTFEGTTLASEVLLELQYSDAALGFLGGAVVSGSWTPFNDFTAIKNLTFSGDLGVFFSTFTETDLSDFSSFPSMPSQIDPGLTVFTVIQMKGTLAKIASFVANNATLQLIANIPLGGSASGASVSAILANSTTTNDFEISLFELQWKSTSADSGEIDLKVEAVINISKTQTLDVIGQGTFSYGDDPALTADLELTGDNGKGWVDPFGIPNLTVVDIIFSLSLSDEGISIGLAGTIDIGAGANAVQLAAEGVFDDFEVPVFVSGALASVDQGKLVTLATLIGDFIDIDLSSFPLLSSISFGNLSFYACAAPAIIGDKTYQPGIGATGDIDFFGYDLDFAFSLITAPTPAVQAKGSISYNNGPIVISGAGITWIKIGGVGTMQYPSACIDTTGGGYCTCSGNITDAYFCLEGSLTMLGLASVTVQAAATKSLFELDVDLSTSSHVLSDKLHIFLDLSTSVFAASNDFSFTPPAITLGPWGVIPQFTIPTPQISVCLALGTVIPTSAPCADGWLPTTAPFFHFDLKFSWGALDFDLDFNIDLNTISNAFNDFGEFIVNWLLQQAKDVLGWILSIGKLIGKALIQLGKDIEEVAQLIAQQLEIAFEDAYNIASEAWDELEQLCGVETGSSAMQPSIMSLASVNMTGEVPAGATAIMRAQPFTPVPEVLAHLAEAPRGQGILTHYYVHRAEADELMRNNADVITRTREQVNAHRASPNWDRDVHLPLVIDLIKTTASAAGKSYQVSAQEVVTLLEPYRDRTYEELLELLQTTE